MDFGRSAGRMAEHEGLTKLAER